jgi:hypothetical protein
MALINSVLETCRRLAPLGWGQLLTRHGLNLDSKTLRNAHTLRRELEKKLNVDRSAPGFEDFWPDGEQAIHAGRPSRSLLYHAFASPLVHPASRGTVKASSYPSLEELDTLENFIYGQSRVSFSDLVPSKTSSSQLVVAVFAYQYRIGARSANGKFASTVLSRTGIARVGTTKYWYDTIRRSFWPINPDAQSDIAVMPARYAAYLALARTPIAEDAILDEQPGDEDRIFLFPIHKLFDGRECLRGSDLSLEFHERHHNEKLARIHSEKPGAGLPVPDGFDITKTPFVRDSLAGDDMVRLQRIGASVLVVPMFHPTLNQVAMAVNNKTGLEEVARFSVPKRQGENRYAGTSFQFLDENFAERRTAPEYVNIRHEVVNPRKPDRIVDLNGLPWKKFKKKIDQGGYEAAHFVDDSCEGCVTVEVTGIQKGEANDINFAAFSMVSAPDFFPLVDQADIMDWSQRVLGTGGEREQFAQGGPRPLSQRRNCVNAALLRPDVPCVPAFPVRDREKARIETITAIVGGKNLGGGEHRPTKDMRFVDPSTSFLPDAASGIFDPGWDTSFSGDDEADFLAAYGLGSPFPEDIKLCAALNSFWPSAAPDATRTFGLFPTGLVDGWNATTAVPLMDDEIGYHQNHPEVQLKLQHTSTGWDGEQGPYFESNSRFVNHAHIEQSDYVSNALKRKISIAKLADVGATQMFSRMNAIRDCIAVLPEEPKRVSATKLLLVSAKPVNDWGARPDRGDRRLHGAGFLFSFAIVDERGRPSTLPGRWIRRVKRRYTCQVGAVGICWRREAKGQLFSYEARISDARQ